MNAFYIMHNQVAALSIFFSILNNLEKPFVTFSWPWGRILFLTRRSNHYKYSNVFSQGYPNQKDTPYELEQVILQRLTRGVQIKRIHLRDVIW